MATGKIGTVNSKGQLVTDPRKSTSSKSTTSTVPAYNAATGATTGEPSAEYNAYLKSLNHKGSANYVNTPDDKGFENMDTLANEKINGGLKNPTNTPAGLQQPTLPGATTQPTTTAMTAPLGKYGSPTTGYFDTYDQAVAAAHKTLQSSGAAPSDGGAAMSKISAVSPTQPDTTAVDAYLGEDPTIGKLMTGITDLLNPINQTTSLMDDYKKLQKESGLDEINQELIDADTIINGTEDDIRNEIQTAGGFGTDSQVQAMALARNKSLLKRYNQLVQMKTDATNQLNTLSSLNAQDKQMAQQKLGTQISAMFNMANFYQQAQNNVKEQYRWLTQTMGVDGVYDAYSKDPRQLAMLEKSLGVAPGGMASLADKARVQRSLDERIKTAQLNKLTEAPTQVVDVGGKKFLINSNTGAVISEIGGTGNVADPYSMAQGKGNIQEIGGLLKSPGLNTSVGTSALTRSGGGFWNGVSRFVTGALGGGVAGAAAGAPFALVGAIPGAIVGALAGGTLATALGSRGQLSGANQEFVAGVEQLRQGLTLDNLVKAKANGATFGALSDSELQLISSSATKLGTWAIKDSDGNVIGYNASESSFKKELDKINNYAKLDMLIKGADPASIGVIQQTDGTYWAVNSDGSVTQIK